MASAKKKSLQVIPSLDEADICIDTTKEARSNTYVKARKSFADSMRKKLTGGKNERARDPPGPSKSQNNYRDHVQLPLLALNPSLKWLASKLV